MKSTAEAQQFNLSALASVQKLLPKCALTKIAPHTSGPWAALLFVVETAEKKFMARKSALFYDREGFAHEIRVQQHAARFGLAPSIIAHDDDHGVSISDFINDYGTQKLFDKDPQTALIEFTKIARALHALPPIDAMIKRDLIDEINKLFKKLPANILHDDAQKLFAAVSQFTWPTDLICVSHFDFKPDNILFDGKQFLVIDWEMAALGHPYFDLAVLSNFLDLDQRAGHDVLKLYKTSAIDDRDLVTLDNFRAISFAFLAAINFYDAIGEKDAETRLVTARDLCTKALLYADALG